MLLEPTSHPGLRQAWSLRERFPQLPILCVSIEAPTEESRPLHPVAHVMKPFRRSQLEQALDLALPPAPNAVEARA